MITDKLIKILKPPSASIECGNQDGWPIIFKRVGSRLPSDYQYFIKTYGTGEICKWLYVYNPFTSRSHFNLIDRIPTDLSGLRGFRRRAPERVPFPLWFEPGGFLPWGRSINGDKFGWITNQEIEDQWTVAVFTRESQFVTFNMCMVQFIADLLRGDLYCPGYPHSGSRKPKVFKSVEQLENDGS